MKMSENICNKMAPLYVYSIILCSLYFFVDRPRQRNRQFHRSTWMTNPKDSWPRFSRPGRLFITITTIIFLGMLF